MEYVDLEFVDKYGMDSIRFEENGIMIKYRNFDEIIKYLSDNKMDMEELLKAKSDIDTNLCMLRRVLEGIDPIELAGHWRKCSESSTLFSYLKDLEEAEHSIDETVKIIYASKGCHETKFISYSQCKLICMGHGVSFKIKGPKGMYDLWTYFDPFKRSRPIYKKDTNEEYQLWQVKDILVDILTGRA